MWLVATKLSGAEVDFFRFTHRETEVQSVPVPCARPQSDSEATPRFNPVNLSLEHTLLALTFP